MTRKTWKKTALALGGLAILAGALPAMGVLLDWSGGADPDGNWSNAFNWAQGGVFGVVDNDEVVIDDTTPQDISIADSGLGGAEIKVKTLFLGDGHTLQVNHAVNVIDWMQIEGTVTVDCATAGVLGQAGYLRICTDQDTTVTKKGTHDFEFGRKAG